MGGGISLKTQPNKATKQDKGLFGKCISCRGGTRAKIQGNRIPTQKALGDKKTPADMILWYYYYMHSRCGAKQRMRSRKVCYLYAYVRTYTCPSVHYCLLATTFFGEERGTRAEQSRAEHSRTMRVQYYARMLNVSTCPSTLLFELNRLPPCRGNARAEHAPTKCRAFFGRRNGYYYCGTCYSSKAVEHLFGGVCT